MNNFKLYLTSEVSETIMVFTMKHLESPWNNHSMMLTLGIPAIYNHVCKFSFHWTLNSSIKGLVESVDVFLNNTKVEADLDLTTHDNVIVNIDMYGIKVKADVMFFPSYEHCELTKLNSIYVDVTEEVEDAIYRQFLKDTIDEKIKAYEDQEAAEKQEFIQYAHSQNIRYWVEEDYYGGFGHSRSMYVFSSSKEWLEKKKEKEFLWDDSYYQVSNIKTIEEFPYWKKALKQRASQQLYEKLYKETGIDLSNSIWFKDGGSIFTNDL